METIAICVGMAIFVLVMGYYLSNSEESKPLYLREQEAEEVEVWGSPYV